MDRENPIDTNLSLGYLDPMQSESQKTEGSGRRPIGIDLFAGAGGLSLGFEQAGFDVKAAVEIDPVHCAVHEFNFPNTAVIARSVVGLTGAEIRKAAGIGNDVVDCVFGGAPCQGFSLIGQRALDDPRNKLVLEFVRIVTELEARSFLFENVKGLTVGRHKAFLTELVEAFDVAGYQVRLPPKVLNAANYGTPQSRERLILFGARKGEALPDYPKWTTNFRGCKRPEPGLDPVPTCEDALGDLPDADRYEELADGDTVVDAEFGAPSPYARELRGENNDPWYFGYERNWERGVLTSSARTGHTEISQRRFAETVPGTVEPISRFFKLAPEGISNTLRAGTDGARGAFTSPRPIHYKYDRCVTVREMARLHGFPDWFRFHVTKWHGARQIGNSVPPPMARAVAGAVMKALGIEPSRPKGKLSLDKIELLSVDLSQAAERFGIEKPQSKRDRKSGATKRKQIEIERERLASL